MRRRIIRFSDDPYIMDPEMDTELSRIYSIPGTEEYMKEFDKEMEERSGDTDFVNSVREGYKGRLDRYSGIIEKLGSN